METRTKCKFVSLDKVTVETSQGDRFTLGLSGVIPFEMQEQHCQIIAALFDKYYQGDPSVIMGPILRGMYQCHCWASIFWYGQIAKTNVSASEQKSRAFGWSAVWMLGMSHSLPILMRPI